MRTCSVEGCDMVHMARGYCGTHYGRFRRGEPIDRPYTRRDTSKFWEYVDRSGGLDSCWEWTRTRDVRGYGKMLRGGVSESLVHRYVYSLAHPGQPMPEAVMHECDNPPCCNPLHLTGGTRRENNRQAAERKRMRRGYSAGGGKIPDEHYELIRALRKAGLPAQPIAEMFGTTRDYVYKIASGKARVA